MLSWPSESWSKVNRKYIVKKVELHFGDLTLKMQLDHYRIFTTEYSLQKNHYGIIEYKYARDVHTHTYSEQQNDQQHQEIKTSSEIETKASRALAQQAEESMEQAQMCNHHWQPDVDLDERVHPGSWKIQFSLFLV